MGRYGKEDAIQMSIQYKKARVEIFKKSNVGYVPTYNYYCNGELVQNV